MTAPHYTPSGAPATGADGASADLRAEFALVEAGPEVLNFFPLSASFDDMNTAGSIFIGVPFACTVEAIYVTLVDNHSGPDTTLTPKIGAVAITGTGSLVFGSSDGLGNVKSFIPTSGNSIGIGATLETVARTGR